MSMPTCLLVRFSHVQLYVTLWTVAHQAPLSMGVPRQEYWNGLPCPSSRDLPDPRMEPLSLGASALQADSLPLSHQRSPRYVYVYIYIYPFRTNTQKRCPFHYKGLECKSSKSRNTWSNRQIWPWNTE